MLLSTNTQKAQHGFAWTKQRKDRAHESRLPATLISPTVDGERGVLIFGADETGKMRGNRRACLELGQPALVLAAEGRCERLSAMPAIMFRACPVRAYSRLLSGGPEQEMRFLVLRFEDRGWTFVVHHQYGTPSARTFYINVAQAAIFRSWSQLAQVAGKSFAN